MKKIDKSIIIKFSKISFFSKVSKFLLKFCLMNKFFGKALKILFKQNEEKSTLATDKIILDTLKQLKLDYSLYYYENEIILKYPKSFAKF